MKSNQLTWIGISSTSVDNNIRRVNEAGDLTDVTTVEEFQSTVLTTTAENYRLFDLDISTTFRKFVRLDGNNDVLTAVRVWRPGRMYRDLTSRTDFKTASIFDIVELYPVPFMGDDIIY